MINNIGKEDKIIRYFLGIVILALGLYYESWWGLLGLIPIVTSVINFCPLYAALGISTKNK